VRRVCWLKVTAVAICIELSLGCGPSIHVIEGEVRLDGKPLESGTIDFEPIDNSSRSFGGDVKDGSYRVEIPPEQAKGTSMVRIMSPQPTGRKVPAGPPAMRGATIDEIAEAIPAQYNTRSTLKVDLSIASPHNFELSSNLQPDSIARPETN
jgi:hypothetical protein